MVKQGKKFPGNVTPLFDSMLVQPIEDEGEVSERPSESQPIPSPTQPSKYHSLIHLLDLLLLSLYLIPIQKVLVGITEIIAQAAEIKDLKAQIKQLKKKTRPISKKRRSVSKQWRKAVKSSKADKGSAKKRGSTKGTDLQQSTVKPDEGTDKQDASTVKSDKGESNTPTNKLKQKEKGVELKNVEDIERPRPTSTRSLLTLKPLLKIDPKAKGKGKIEEEDEYDTESEDINEAEKKFKMLANDEEMARKARLNADKILAEKLQEEEREKFTIEERAKLLHDTIAAQRRFLAQQRSKHVGGKKHSDLKTKIFEEIQVLYEKVKRSDENFIAIGSVEDERLIKDLNKKVASKDDSIKQESKEEGTKKRKLGTRKKMKSRKRRFRQNTSEDDSEKENDELRLCLSIASDEDKEINLNVVIRSNGQRRYFSTLMRVLSIFDREDLSVVYQLVMDRYQDEIPEELEPKNSNGDEEDL
ncbi:hypothetical protein Tco_0913258 [Tanacetum coccineum]